MLWSTAQLKISLDFIFMKDSPSACDVILIPGTSKSAVTEKAAELYREGWAPYILPSGECSSNVGHFARENIDNPKYDGDYASDFEYCKHILLANGVPDCAILQENQATNSMENAMYSATVLKSVGISVKRAIICCQAFPCQEEHFCHILATSLEQNYWLCLQIRKELPQRIGT